MLPDVTTLNFAVDAFNPSTREGVRDVKWFTPAEACEVVTHTSLRPLMVEARRIVEGGDR